jgi:hypothetical protein
MLGVVGPPTLAGGGHRATPNRWWPSHPKPAIFSFFLFFFFLNKFIYLFFNNFFLLRWTRVAILLVTRGADV